MGWRPFLSGRSARKPLRFIFPPRDIVSFLQFCVFNLNGLSTKIYIIDVVSRINVLVVDFPS